jgi:5-methylcytosine-specific restriction endonuclease McrA
MVQKEYSFVLDSEGKKLSPTNTKKAWFLIRKERAKLIQKYPMVIQLMKTINEEQIDKSEITLGIDDGSKYVGFGLVQNSNKVIMKATMNQRNDVKKKMDLRRGERRYRRAHKRYRPARFNNRANSRKEGRLAPSIKQKRQAVLRVVNQISKYCRIDKIVLEDVQIDIRRMTDGLKYGSQYQQSDKLDKKIRIATLMRDGFACQLTGEVGTKMEVHHITPRKHGGANTLSNTITLSKTAHAMVTGREYEFADKFYKIINGNNKRFSFAQHVMQGKKWLQGELSRVADLELTTGVDTYLKRKELGVVKSHSNDGLVIAGLSVGFDSVKDWIIKPLRKKRKSEGYTINGLTFRDLVHYKARTGKEVIGYVVSILNSGKSSSITDLFGKRHSRLSASSFRLIYRPGGIMWV